MITQIETVKDLLTTSNATIVGVLLVSNLVLVRAVFVLWKRCNELQDKRVMDSESFRSTAMDLTERTLNAINQMTEITNRLSRRHDEN